MDGVARRFASFVVVIGLCSGSHAANAQDRWGIDLAGGEKCITDSLQLTYVNFKTEPSINAYKADVDKYELIWMIERAPTKLADILRIEQSGNRYKIYRRDGSESEAAPRTKYLNTLWACEKGTDGSKISKCIWADAVAFECTLPEKGYKQKMEGSFFEGRSVSDARIQDQIAVLRRLSDEEWGSLQAAYIAKASTLEPWQKDPKLAFEHSVKSEPIGTTALCESTRILPVGMTIDRVSYRCNRWRPRIMDLNLLLDNGWEIESENRSFVKAEAMWMTTGNYISLRLKKTQ